MIVEVLPSSLRSSDKKIVLSRDNLDEPLLRLVDDSYCILF